MRFIRRMATVGPLASRSATAMVWDRSWSSGTHLLISPIRSASAAPTKSPSQSISSAFGVPTSRGSIQAPPSPATKPMRM